MITDALAEENYWKFSGCKIDNILIFQCVYWTPNNVIFKKNLS